MPSLTALTTTELLTQALEYIAQVLADCGFEVCATQRTHTEPRNIQCCDECADNYALFGWVVRTYSSDFQLNEIQSANCPSLDATTMGFTIARCWPETAVVPKIGGVMDAAAVELLEVHDCLRIALGSCADNPELFRPIGKPGERLHCVRLQVSNFLPEKSVVVTPYGDSVEGGKVSHYCAGWKFSITVA